MSTISSPDGAFRIFNWNTVNDAGLHSHFCYVVVPTRGDKPNTIYTFKEDRITIPPKPDNTLTPANWYGALYYNILPIKKGNKTFYTILGYNGGSTSTNKKIIDVFYFKGKNLRIGYPLFQESATSERLVRRVFFEYSEKTTIAVNMNERMGAIVFDHLAPETPNLVGFFDYYVPDMTYDAYRWNGTIWQYEEDLIAVNKENRKTRVYKPTDVDESEDFIEVKDVWVNPVDNGAPIGVSGGNPIAPVKEEVEGSKKGKKDKNKNKRHKRLFQKKSKKPRSAVTG
jgi:hypothetical protein